MAFRLILARKLGPEPLGLTGMVFPVYRFLLILATMGLLPTLTRLAALQTEANQLQTDATEEGYHRLIFLSSIVFSILLAALAPLLGRFVFPDSRVTTLFIIGAFALPLSSVIVARRASLQGKDQNWPLVNSEWGEQLAEAAAVLSIILSFSLPCLQSAQVMMVGFLLGESACLSILNNAWRKIKPRRRRPIDNSSVRREVTQGVRESFPVLANQFISAASSMAEGWIIPNRLVFSGLSVQAATIASGELWGMILPIVYAPLLFINPLSILVLPRTARWEKRESRAKTLRKITLLLMITGILGILCTWGIVTYASQLSLCFYGNLKAAHGIKSLAPIIPFTYITVLTATVLQGFGRYWLLTGITVISVVVRIGMIYALTGLPAFRLQGTMLGVLSAQALTAALCLLALGSLASSNQDKKRCLSPRSLN